MKALYLLPLMLVSTCAYGQIVTAGENEGSLWSDKSNPLSDRIARKQGDILTIIISETSTATFAAATTTQKDEANSVTQPVVPILSALNLVPNLAGLGNGSLSSKATGSTSSGGTFTAKMSAVIKKVLPNGNLVLEGSRLVKVNKDTQTFILTGVIRADDVRSDNTVLSESLADADIRVDGKGAIADRQRRGILSRLLDWLF